MCPEGPSTQYLRFPIPLMVFRTRVLEYWVLGHGNVGVAGVEGTYDGL